MSRWKTLSRRTLVDSPWLRVHRARVALPNGTEIDDFFSFEIADWTLVVCTDVVGNFVLVEQYRHGIGQVTLELPAGDIEPGEDPLEAAVRELREETGYESSDWTPLGVLYPEPPRSPSKAHVFVARAARRVAEQRLDQAEEGLRVAVVDRNDLLGPDVGAKIVHGVHLGALWLARSRGLLELPSLVRAE
jgi:8-oxo-dGTP pyrophosphatase MutT (NUDIX family)